MRRLQQHDLEFTANHDRCEQNLSPVEKSKVYNNTYIRLGSGDESVDVV